MRTTKKWNKMLTMAMLGMVLAFTLVSVGCNTVTSSLAYPSPLIVEETGIFHGKAIDYAGAWYNAVQNGKAAGFKRIISETTEQNSFFNEVVVTIVMVK